MPNIVTNGIKTHYEIKGSGPVLIFASGLGGTAAYWAPQVDEFSKNYTVVTYDQRGAGTSDYPDGPYSINMLVDDLKSLIDELKLEHPFLVGHSTGGAIGQVLASRDPWLLSGLVLYSSWGKSDDHFNWCFRMRKALLEGASLEEYVHGSALFLYPPEHIRNQAKHLSPELLASVAKFPPRDVIIRRIDAIMAHDSLDKLGAISIPTLVMCAQDDILTPPYQSKLMAERIPGSQLKMVPHGGHSFSETQTEIFNELTFNFLASISTPSF